MKRVMSSMLVSACSAGCATTALPGDVVLPVRRDRQRHHGHSGTLATASGVAASRSIGPPACPLPRVGCADHGVGVRVSRTIAAIPGGGNHIGVLGKWPGARGAPSGYLVAVIRAPPGTLKPMLSIDPWSRRPTLSLPVPDCPFLSLLGIPIPKLNVEGSSPFARST